MTRRVSSVRHVQHHAQHVRWDELALEKITEMVSRKVIAGRRHTFSQIWLKRGALAARHVHDGEQSAYVLDGALRVQVSDPAAPEAPMNEVIVRAGEVIVIPAGAPHQVEALDDALVIRILVTASDVPPSPEPPAR